MKATLRLLLLAASPVFLFSCKDKIEEYYTVNEPVYMSYDELRGPLKIADGQDIVHPGKIYFKDNYIFVNEYMKGIHVIDNSHPASPEIIKFIEIPGNVDMAIKDNILYADSYVDLVALDISNLEDIKEVKRITDAFPYILPPCEDGVIENVDESKGVVMSWRPTERKVDIKNNEDGYHWYPIYEYDMFVSASSEGYKGGNGSSGTGGSMARFTVYEDYLFAINNYSLRLFNISSAADPLVDKDIYVGWNVETIFPYDHKLFLGSTTGMYVYSLEDPANPSFLTMFWHASACDPVVVRGNYAYVTLRAGNLCGNDLSQLDVIDISDIVNPVLLKEYPMTEPYGLGIDENILFVCDGDAGLKVYDASDPMAISSHQLAQYPDINAWDVIPLGDVLIMIGTDGLYQYDYSDPEHITELSVIPIVQLTHPVN